jgi:hypothetical protein
VQLGLGARCFVARSRRLTDVISEICEMILQGRERHVPILLVSAAQYSRAHHRSGGIFAIRRIKQRSCGRGAASNLNPAADWEL